MQKAILPKFKIGMKNTNEKFVSGNGETIILTNTEYDPAMWIVEIFKKSMFGKKKTGSYWFSHKGDAEDFVADYIKR
jgi:hypothetical protein